MSMINNWLFPKNYYIINNNYKIWVYNYQLICNALLLTK